METHHALIIAADPLARAGLATLLEAQEGWQITARLAGPADLDLYHPEALVWDSGWEFDAPARAALRDSLAEIAAEDPAPAVALLLADPDSAPGLIHAGARALLPRDVSGPALDAALRAALNGLLVIDPAFSEALARPDAALLDAAPAASGDALTARELEVLALIAEGQSNRAIAYRLGISAHTVKFHVNAILAKLDARSRTEAVVRASRQGLLLL